MPPNCPSGLSKRALEAAAGEAQAPVPRVPKPRLENCPSIDASFMLDPDVSELPLNFPIPCTPASLPVEVARASKKPPHPQRGDFLHLDTLTCQDEVFFYKHAIKVCMPFVLTVPWDLHTHGHRSLYLTESFVASLKLQKQFKRHS